MNFNLFFGFIAFAFIAISIFGGYFYLRVLNLGNRYLDIKEGKRNLNKRIVKEIHFHHYHDENGKITTKEYVVEDKENLENEKEDLEDEKNLSLVFSLFKNRIKTK